VVKTVEAIQATQHVAQEMRQGIQVVEEQVLLTLLMEIVVAVEEEAAVEIMDKLICK
jgi:hypothetical protein